VPAPDPSDRALAARIASSTRWSREDPNDPDGPLPRARAAFDARFYANIPADLPESERDRRAASARKAYFAKLALASVKARRAARNAPNRSTAPPAA
jgi:hypothetical protein